MTADAENWFFMQVLVDKLCCRQIMNKNPFIVPARKDVFNVGVEAEAKYVRVVLALHCRWHYGTVIN